MKRNPDLETPWNATGLLHSPRKVMAHEAQPEWRGNEPFWARLKLLGTERVVGGSAAFYRWQIEAADDKDMVGQVLPMFLTDMGHLITQGVRSQGGVVEGTWFVVKRGSNYGITPQENAPATAPESPSPAPAQAARH